MKNRAWNLRSSKLFGGSKRRALAVGAALAFGSVAGASGCASPNSVSVKGYAPAQGADATLSLARRESGNNKLDLTVHHLLPPSRINQRYTHYAVWVVPQNGEIRLAGRLLYDAADRTGTFSSITPYDNLRVLVTAETDTRRSQPSGQVILEEDLTAG